MSVTITEPDQIDWATIQAVAVEDHVEVAAPGHSTTRVVRVSHEEDHEFSQRVFTALHGRGMA